MYLNVLIFVSLNDLSNYEMDQVFKSCQTILFAQVIPLTKQMQAQGYIFEKFSRFDMTRSLRNCFFLPFLLPAFVNFQSYISIFILVTTIFTSGYTKSMTGLSLSLFESLLLPNRLLYQNMYNVYMLSQIVYVMILGP